MKLRPTRWHATRRFRAGAASIATALAVSTAVAVTGMTSSAATASTASTIFTTQTPQVALGGDTNGVDLGVKFKSDTDGEITGIRFYKGGTSNGGTHTGYLWALDGTQLASVTFAGETASGWQTATFTNPVNITAGTTYIASYVAPQGHYSYTSNGLGTATDNAPLHALASSASGGNGVYKYLSAGLFPNQSYNSTNYWVDVLFLAGVSASPSSSATSSPSPTPSTSASSTPTSSPSPSSSSTSTSGGMAHIWPNGTPSNPSVSDSNSVNVGVKFTSDTAGYIYGVRFYKGTGNTGTHVGSLWDASGHLLAQGTFTGETTTGWQDLQFTNPVPITASTQYVASYLAPYGDYAGDGNGLGTATDNAPLHALASSASGGNGVYGYGLDPAFPTKSYNATNYWVDVDFSTTTPSVPNQPQATPRAGTRGNGPVLVITDPANPFTDDVCAAILQTEGLPECAATDAGNITDGSQLSGYRVVIWADGAPPTSAQVAILTTWTTNGGSFIALRPNDVLDSLLGIGPKVANAILPDAYYKVDTTQAPGVGIESQVMQYHGIADEHPLAGARAAAALYSNSTTPTGYPALTINTVGSGTAAAYMFDPSRSILLTRNGNPGFSGQTTTTDTQPRLGDRFGDGYLDTTKAAIPQADELGHLLTNQVEQATSAPRLWYLPTYGPSTHPGGLVNAAIVLTGDDHNSGSSQTLNRFAAEQAASPTGCSVADWMCYTSSSYTYAGSFPDAAAKPYTDQGFEVSFHASNGTNCLDWSNAGQLSSLTNSSLQAWQTAYPSISAAHPPLTERFHCYGIQRSFAGIAAEEQSLGIVADTNTSCFPQGAFNVPQCLISGTALPMPYVNTDGTLTGVYQLSTQVTDENPTTVGTGAIQTLIQNATGPNGYVGYYTILAHLDNGGDSNAVAGTALSTAQSAGIPMVSAAQAAQFIQGRAGTGISGVTYTASTETFSVTNPVHNLEMLIPMAYGAKTLTAITCNGSSLPMTQVTVNGMAYAAVPSAGAGSYVGTYN